METIKEEYTRKMLARYGRLTGRRARGSLLDEFIELHRMGVQARQQSARGQAPEQRPMRKAGAPRKYGTELTKVRKGCWLAMEQPCGKRIKDLLPIWSKHLDCLEEIRIQLGKISAASIDRLLHGFKARAGKRIRPPKPQGAVKALVEFRAQS